MKAAQATDLMVWARDRRDMAPHVTRLSRYARDARVAVEFGVRSAVSTWALLDGLPPDGQLWSVDIRRSPVPPRVSADPRWHFILGDDQKPSILTRLPERADLVFIDTSHEYKHTLAELDTALAMHPRWILLHDAEWSGVSCAVFTFLACSGWRVREFNEAHDVRGGFSLVVLEP